MTTRTFIIYWLLLVVPAALLGAAGFVLLGHERDRLQQADARAAEQRAELLARQITLAVADVEGSISQHLRELPADGLTDALAQLERHHPLVRNAFIWREPNVLVYPNPERPATAEHTLFIQRYHSLFSGRQPWPAAANRESAQAATPAPRQNYYGKMQMNLPEPEVQRLTWFWENQLHVLLAYQPSPGAPIRGVEVEMAAFLARLLPALPTTAVHSSMPSRAESTMIRLIDGHGSILHQIGGASLETAGTGFRRLARVPVGDALPHWQVSVYELKQQLPIASGFYLVGLMLLGIFIVAIVGSGSLLLWQARRQALEVRQKADFVSNVSHELKTPLTSIRMYAELLEEGRAKTQAKQRQYLGIIVDEAQRLTRLVNNVLDFSRFDQGHKHYHLEAAELSPLVTEILDTHALRLEQAGLALHRAIAPLTRRVWLDRDALEQIIVNLLDNAMKYAATGGEVTITLAAGAQTASLTVADRGPGVPPAHAERIFAAFHRVDDSLASGQSGTGLGLCIARRLARDLGGDLTYQANPGGGASFTLTLPLQ